MTATRLFIAWRNTANGSPLPAPVSPAFSSSWNGNSGARIAMISPKGAAGGPADGGTWSSPGDLATQPVGTSYGIVQAVGPQIAFGGTISGSFRAVVSARMVTPNTNEHSKIRAIVRVVSADGLTVRGTLVDGVDSIRVPSTSSTANAVTLGPVDVTPVVTQPGDRVVIELGTYREPTSGTSGVVRAVSTHHGDVVSVADFDFNNYIAPATRVSWFELDFPPGSNKVGGTHIQTLAVPSPSSTKVGSVQAQVLIPAWRSSVRVGSAQVQVLVPATKTQNKVGGTHTQVLVGETWVVSASDGETAIQQLHSDGVWRPIPVRGN